MKLIYLDSSDFSDLSNPPLSEESQKTLEILRFSKQSGIAKYALSLIHLAEATHASEKYKEYAAHRAALMTELCESRTLRFPNEIFTAEITQALASGSGKLDMCKVYSSEHQWFGIDLKPDIAAWRNQADNSLKEKAANLSRRERRKFASELNLNTKEGEKTGARCCVNRLHPAYMSFHLT